MSEVAYRGRVSMTGSAGMARYLMHPCMGLAVMACLAGQAHAQVDATVSVVSDYRFRGVSLSHGRAEPQLQLGYDAPGGWYAGAFASGTDLRNEVRTPLQVEGYGGYASRDKASGRGWDVGFARSFWPGAGRYDYSELYAGLNSERVNARLSYSPRYFGIDSSTLYVEANGSVALWRRLHLQWHAGYLHVLENVAYPYLYPNPYAQQGADLRIGIAAVINTMSAQLAWAGKRRRADGDTAYESTPSHAWIVSVNLAF